MNYKFREHIDHLSRITYVGEDKNRCEGNIIDCSLGNNPFGCSPVVEQALREVSLQEVAGYPPFPYPSLRKQISEYWRGIADVPEECVRLGSGAMSLLNLLNMLFISQNSTVLGYCPQFSDYMNNVFGFGGRYDYYPLLREKRYTFDCDAFLGYLKKNHCLAYLDNPNNPTGQVIPLDQIREIARRAQQLNVTLIVDEAYGEFMPASNSAIVLQPEFENIIVVKSFSKGFGLAGLRAGYFVASKRLIENYQKIEVPFSINVFAAAAVSAALSDRSFIEDTAEKIGAVKTELIQACHKLVCAATGEQVSIMVLQHPNEIVDLHTIFLEYGVETEVGDGFIGLKRNSVRIRIPSEANELKKIIWKVENEIR